MYYLCIRLQINISVLFCSAKMESLLIKTLNLQDKSEELKLMEKLYNDDVNISVLSTLRGGSRKFRKRGPGRVSHPPFPPPPPPPPPHTHTHTHNLQMKTSLYRTRSNKATLTFQNHFKTARIKGGRGPLGPSPKSAYGPDRNFTSAAEGW